MKKEISIHHLYGFIQDKYYFNIMDEILKVNPNQKFFISHDLNYELISYYKDRYGEKVMFKGIDFTQKEFLWLLLVVPCLVFW